MNRAPWGTLTVGITEGMWYLPAYDAGAFHPPGGGARRVPGDPPEASLGFLRESGLPGGQGRDAPHLRRPDGRVRHHVPRVPRGREHRSHRRARQPHRGEGVLDPLPRGGTGQHAHLRGGGPADPRGGVRPPLLRRTCPPARPAGVGRPREGPRLRRGRFGRGRGIHRGTDRGRHREPVQVMSFINYSSREINCKIVYYGPGLCGKTTNLQYIYGRMTPETRGKMISLATETERTLFFDFLPLSLGEVRGFKTRFHLYTVPGQVFYDASRRLILRGVDGVVFCADSQLIRTDANLESMENLRGNLREQGHDPDKAPLVIQYNKRDLPNIASLAELHALLNQRNVPEFEASATRGIGVFETLKSVIKLVLIGLKRGG